MNGRKKLRASIEGIKAFYVGQQHQVLQRHSTIVAVISVLETSKLSVLETSKLSVLETSKLKDQTQP